MKERAKQWWDWTRTRIRAACWPPCWWVIVPLALAVSLWFWNTSERSAVRAEKLATAAGAAIGLALAFRGLEAWRTQLKGTARFEASVALLQAVVAVRRTFASTRSPFMDTDEQQRALSARGENLGEGFPGQTQMHRAYMLAMFDRFKKLAEAVDLADKRCTDAEILLGQTVRDRFNRLRALAIEYKVRMDELAEAPFTHHPNFNEHHQIATGIGGPDDVFANRIDQAVAGIRAVTDPHVVDHYNV